MVNMQVIIRKYLLYKTNDNVKADEKKNQNRTNQNVGLS